MDDGISYRGQWNHVCGLGNTKWNRTLSYGTANADNPTKITFDFAGIGFSLIGKQEKASRLRIVVDGQMLDWNRQPQTAADRTENILVSGLTNGEHKVKLTVIDGTYTLDAVEWLA